MSFKILGLEKFKIWCYQWFTHFLLCCSKWQIDLVSQWPVLPVSNTATKASRAFWEHCVWGLSLGWYWAFQISNNDRIYFWCMLCFRLPFVCLSGFLKAIAGFLLCTRLKSCWFVFLHGIYEHIMKLNKTNWDKNSQCISFLQFFQQNSILINI